MSQTPSLTEIRNNIAGDVRSLSGEADPSRLGLALSVGEALAGGVYAAYAQIDYVSDQLFPDTADAEHLIRAGNWRSYSLSPASHAAGRVRFTGTVGRSIPAGFEVQNSAGAVYATQATVLIGSDGTATAPVRAAEAGSAGNTSGRMFTLSSAAGIDSVESVSAIDGGSDQETIEALRQRIMTADRGDNRYGKSGDYVSWALEASTLVGQAWERTNTDNLGTLTVYVHGVDSVLGESTLDEIRTLIELNRPADVRFNVIQAALKSVPFTVQVQPDTAAMRIAVEKSIEQFIYNSASPGSTIQVAEVESHVSSSVSGVTQFSVSIPTGDVGSARNELITFGGATF